MLKIKIIFLWKWLGNKLATKKLHASTLPVFRDSSYLRVGRKMATFQLFFLSGQAKDLSTPL